MPYIMYKRRKIIIKREANHKDFHSGDTFNTVIDDDIRLQAEIESTKDEYVVSCRDAVCRF